MWRKISLACGPVLAVLTVYNVGVHMSHEHHHEEEEPMKLSYQKIRNKEYPWTERDCTFFDWDCKKKWHAAQALK